MTKFYSLLSTIKIGGHKMKTINDFKFYNYTDKSINIELLCDENRNIWLDKENITTLLSIQIRQVYKYYQLYFYYFIYFYCHYYLNGYFPYIT